MSENRYNSLQSGAGNQHSPAPYLLNFNLNDYIWFKPKVDLAKKYIAERADRIVRRYTNPEKVRELFMETVKSDTDGWCRWQAWHFMQVFGASFQMGMDNVIEMEVRFEVKPWA